MCFAGFSSSFSSPLHTFCRSQIVRTDKEKGGTVNAHPLGPRRSTASDLLNTQGAQLGLEFVELLGEVILALSPELTSLDLG